MVRGLVAIVGRPNVGKSTLFNRLVGERMAIVHDEPGVTRDRLYGDSHWNGIPFAVVDTGGYVPLSEDVFEAGIREQVEVALQEADVVLFITDAKAGLTPHDEEIAEIIRRSGKQNVLAVVNKVDDHHDEIAFAEFYGLGFETLFPIASASGKGTGELLDEVVHRLSELPEPVVEEGIPRIAIVGRPNVGKSSLINALLNEDRTLVTPIAGTTRDSLLTRYRAFGFDYYLVDTAGVRRKARVHENVEFYSVMRTLRAIENCDIAILMIDATEGIEAQDLALLRLIVKNKKGLIILANKWDLVEKKKNADRELVLHIEQRISPISSVPILLVSALEKQRIHKAMETVQEMMQGRALKIPTRELNDTLLPIIEQTPPPSHGGRMVRIKFVTQVPAPNPTFLFFANHPQHVKENYQRFLENQLRKLYGFKGWPLTLVFKQK